MTVIGISFTHDGSLVVLKDGKNVFSMAEERLNRQKSYIGFPFQALRYVIEKRIVTPQEVDHIAIAAGVFKKEWAWSFAFELTEDKKYYDIQNSKRPADFYLHDDEYKKIDSDEACRLYVENKMRGLFDAVGIKAPIVFYDHHRCHAASAYYTGGYDEALAITLDGEGDEKSGSVSVCRDGILETIHTMPVKSSIGWLYSAVTSHLGFKVSRHEGKITGLAAYGNPDVTKEYFEHEVRFQNGSITFPRARYSANLRMRLRAKLKLSRYYTIFWHEIVGEIGKKVSKEDLAAGVQYILEKRVTQFVEYWVKKTGIKNIVTSGGVFANVKLNQRVASLAEVESFYVYPDMGDGGNAYGAAILAHVDQTSPQGVVGHIQSVYLGPEFSNEEIRSALEAHPTLTYERSPNAPLAAAQLVAQKKIIGWFQGRMEYGPRALGNRSILADPTDASINAWLNKRMKRTEFMPFAPSCLYEAADEVFHIGKETMKFPAEFMTITFDVKEGWQKKIAAVTHVDGTARPQLVRKEVNPRYFGLLTEYKKLTGLPLLINTSFNVHEEPIVCKPEEAILSLVNGVIDALVIGDYIATNKA